LPAILFMMMGAVYTYCILQISYTINTIALWAVLILLTAQHIILSNTDVRAEAYLTGLIIASVYHFYKSQNGNSLAPGAGLPVYRLRGNDKGNVCPHHHWRGHCRAPDHYPAMETAVSLAMVIGYGIGRLIFILPEIWCLYHQFDLHPEKIVFGHTGVSGVKFFFWDSQFGRFFNTGPIKGSGDPYVFYSYFVMGVFALVAFVVCCRISVHQKRGQKYASAGVVLYHAGHSSPFYCFRHRSFNCRIILISCFRFSPLSRRNTYFN
jgi:hypothetical protein